MVMKRCSVLSLLSISLFSVAVACGDGGSSSNSASVSDSQSGSSSGSSAGTVPTEGSGGISATESEVGSLSDSASATETATIGSMSDSASMASDGTTTEMVVGGCGDGIVDIGEECDDGEANNGDDKLCGSDCTLHISDGMRDLDWSYICTEHLSFNSTSVRIDGLENDRRYNFYLVAYDKFGNPAPFSKLVTAIPVETYDVWDQCHVLGDVCGKSGFCNVAGDGDPLLGFGGLLGLGLGFAGLRRRKRNRA